MTRGVNSKQLHKPRVHRGIRRIARRKVGDLEIIFYETHRIYVKYKYGIILCTREFVKERGFYKNNWRPFYRALLRKNIIDMAIIRTLADVMEIDILTATAMPDDYDENNAILLPEKYKYR